MSRVSLLVGALVLIGLTGTSSAALRPYNLDVDDTVTVQGTLHCPLYTTLCDLLEPGVARFSKDTIKVSMTGLPGAERSDLISRCSHYGCIVSLTGRVLKGINQPVVLVHRVRFH